MSVLRFKVLLEDINSVSGAQPGVEYRPYGSSHNTVPTGHHTTPSLRLITQYRPCGSLHNTVPTGHHTTPSLRLITQYCSYGSPHNTVPTVITQYRPYGSSHNTVPTQYLNGKRKETKSADTRRIVFCNSALRRI